MTPYRIEEKIGEGGMGSVYRAFDTKLNRPVAIKFLSNELADATARHRFQREAQMASSLNHPHILTVHDAGEFEGRQYLVTEYIDGGTLKEWARAGKHTWPEVVDLLVGVADGLATAHAAGIMHRDIKPANILLTKSGYAKLADFGLAKLMEDRKSEEWHTKTGLVVGTIAYLSPDQAAGQPVDARSDIFSFGVILYEMLAGKRPFAGATDLEVMQKIIHAAPEPLGHQIPAALRAVVDKALEKNPEERYQSMREMVVDLRRITRQSTETVALARPFASRRMYWYAALMLVAIAAAVIVYRSQQSASPARMEYVQLTTFADSATSPALSPDGRMLTFIRGESTFAGTGEIYVKLLPNGDPVQLTHDGLSKMSPVFLPDGSRISYSVVNGGMGAHNWDTWTVPVLGGEPSRMLSNASALEWIGTNAGSPRVMFSEWGVGSHLKIIAADGNRARARTVYAPVSLDGMAHRSYLSPDGKNVLVVEMDGGWRPCRLIPFEGGGPGKLVGPSPGQCTTAAWSPDGKWMYFSANTGNGYHIWRQRYPDGSPEQVTVGASEEEGISFAPGGKAFVTSIGTLQSTIWVHDARGDRQITSQGYATLPSFSADGTKLYYLLRSRSNRRFVSGELWVTNLATEKNTRLLPDSLMEHYSVSADGERIVYAAIDENGHTPVWLATLDRSAAPRRLSALDASRVFFGGNGDVFFLGWEDERSKFVYRMKEDGSGLQKAIPRPVAYMYDVSPDGKLLAVLTEEGTSAYPTDGGERIQVCPFCSGAGGDRRGVTPPAASWSADGKYFHLNMRSASQIYAVPLQPGKSLPLLPPAGIRSQADADRMPGVKIIREARAYVSANPDVYAFPRLSTHRNIYQIPVP
ncbi:MAG: protein kinase [Candidatus Solibacter usitatus]|nr:protein kinase [Candidatus Solibacter usitatus]